MANMKKEYKMSAERKEELQKELTYLKTVREKEVADLIKEARGFGDLSENSEYDEAKNEQGKLYSRIAEVEEILLHTVIVDENDAGTNAGPQRDPEGPPRKARSAARRGPRPLQGDALRRDAPCSGHQGQL